MRAGRHTRSMRMCGSDVLQLDFDVLQLSVDVLQLSFDVLQLSFVYCVAHLGLAEGRAHDTKYEDVLS